MHLFSGKVLYGKQARVISSFYVDQGCSSAEDWDAAFHPELCGNVLVQ